MSTRQCARPRGAEGGPLKAKSVSLGEIATVVTGQSPPGSTYNETGLGMPFFQGKADFGGSHPIARKWCTSPKKIAEEGDILISIRAPIGPTNIALERCCIGRGLAIIRPDETIALRDFVHWVVINRRTELIAKGQGSTFTAIGKNDLKSLKILLPSAQRTAANRRYSEPLGPHQMPAHAGRRSSPRLRPGPLRQDVRRPRREPHGLERRENR